MSAAAVLPMLWAMEHHSVIPQQMLKAAREPLPYEMAFYRKYTEGILRRYVRLSMESGKVPSLLGQEMFRGKVTTYRMGSFVDSVIFVHDVDKCIAKLDEEQQQLISRIAIQQYTLGEAANLLGLSPRTVVRRYGQAIDRLTRVFLSVQMLEPQKCCQEEGITNYRVNA
jgi:sigma-70-like protein